MIFLFELDFRRVHIAFFPTKPCAPVISMFISRILLGQLLLDVCQGGDLCLGLGHGQKLGVVGVELGKGVALGIALIEVLVVVEAALVAGDAVEVAHVDGTGALLVGQQGLVHLLTVTDTDDLNLMAGSKQTGNAWGLLNL